MLSFLQSWLLIFSMLPLFMSPTASDPDLEYTILPSSRLFIKGYSNIDNFTCNFEMKDLRPVKLKKASSGDSFEYVSTEFPVSSFNCGGPAINRDFKSLLKEKSHPFLYVRLLSIEPVSESRAKVSLEFKIAGIANLYEMEVDYIKEKTHLRTQGNFRLNIEDHGLVQPKRLLGLIVVRKEIDVHFNLDFI